MAIETRHLSGSLRFEDNLEDTISSYHRIRPDILRIHVESFLNSVNIVRGQTGGNAFLTLTTQLVDPSAISNG